MFGFLVHLENLEGKKQVKQTRKVAPFYEKERHFLPVCYEQTTRKEAPFSTKNRDKNRVFQVFSRCFLVIRKDRKPESPSVSTGYRNLSDFAYLQPRYDLGYFAQNLRGLLSIILSIKRSEYAVCRSHGSLTTDSKDIGW